MLGFDEPCAYHNPKTGLTVLTIVDDMIVRGSRVETDKFYAAMEGKFELKDPTYLTSDTPLQFIGYDITMHDTVHGPMYNITQEQSMSLFLHEVGYKAKHITTPTVTSGVLYEYTEGLSEDQAHRFRSIVGSLNYFSQSTRYDISYAVSRVSQFMTTPTVGAMMAVDRILAYLAGSVEFGISNRYVPTEDTVQYYCDSDCGGSLPYTSRSQTGYLLMLNHVPVYWHSSKQPKTALNSGTAEIYAMSECLLAARVFQYRARDMGIELPQCVLLQADSKTAVSFQRATCMNSRLRGHFSLRQQWVQELRDRDRCRVVHVSGQQQLADMFTKVMRPVAFRLNLNKIRYGVSGRVASDPASGTTGPM